MVEREDGWLVGWRGRMKRHDNSRREETADEMKTAKTRGGSRRFMELAFGGQEQANEGKVKLRLMNERGGVKSRACPQCPSASSGSMIIDVFLKEMHRGKCGRNMA